MKMPILLAAAAALLATPAGARHPGPSHGNLGGWPGAPADCPMTVAFTSIGTGIDGLVLARVERRLRTDRRVRLVTRHPWGREGEVTLCVRPRQARSLVALAADVRAMIPARPHAPIQVRAPVRPPYRR